MAKNLFLMRVDVFPSVMSLHREAVIHNNGFQRIFQVPLGAVIAHNMAYFGGISTEKSVKGMRRVIERFDLERDTGSFVQFDGTFMPW